MTSWDSFHHILDTLLNLDHSHQMWLVVILLGGSQGYWIYQRMTSKPQRVLADRAHAEVEILAKLITNTDQHFYALQNSLLAIDRSLNTLSVMGPERVAMVLADIRQHVGKCLAEIEAVRKLVSADPQSEPE